MAYWILPIQNIPFGVFITKDDIIITDATANVGGHTISFYINNMKVNSKILYQERGLCSH
jgi:hypothetical protein